MTKKIFGSVLIFIICLLFPPNTLAFEYSKFGIDWTHVDQSYPIDLSTGMHIFSPAGFQTSYEHSTSKILTNNSTIKFVFNVSNFNGFGSGIYFSRTISPYPQVDPTFRDFGVWIDNEGLRLFSYLCIEGTNCDNSLRADKTLSFDTGPHTILITRIDRIVTFKHIESNFEIKYRLRSDDDLYINVGNPETTQTSAPWAEYTIVDAQSILDKVVSKVVVVPGLGASWNKNALLLGQTGGTWTLPSFVKTYDRFFSSLESSGLVKDTDYFVFAYDWRKTISDLAIDLDSFIDGLRSSGKLAANEKFSIVGHSMGGLVARQFVLNHGVNSIEKLITVATPNQGLVDAYGLWLGAKVWSGLWWQKALLALNIVNSKTAGELPVDTVRRTFPGAKDLLPTYDYILKDSVIPESSMINRNLYLAKLNVDSASNSGVLTSLAGTGFSTKAMVKTVDRTAEEAVLKMWEDGKPNPSSPFESSPDGDGALIVESALGAVENKVLYSFSNHGGIMSSDDGLTKLLGELLETPVLSGTDINENSTSSLVLFLKSPGRLSVCLGTVCDADLGIYSAVDKTFFVPSYTNANLSVKVISDGDSGNYSLNSVEILNNGDLVSDSVQGNLTLGGTNQHEYITNVGFEEDEEEPTTEEWLASEVQALVSVVGGKWDGHKLTALLLKERREIERIHLIRLIEDISLLGVKLNAKKSPAKSQAFWRFTLALDRYSTLVIDDSNLNKLQVENQIKVTEKELVRSEKVATKKGGWALTFYQNSQRLITQAKVSVNTSTNLASQQAWLAMRLIQMIYLM